MMEKAHWSYMTRQAWYATYYRELRDKYVRGSKEHTMLSRSMESHQNTVINYAERLINALQDRPAAD